MKYFKLNDIVKDIKTGEIYTVIYQDLHTGEVNINSEKFKNEWVFGEDIEYISNKEELSN